MGIDRRSGRLKRYHKSPYLSQSHSSGIDYTVSDIGFHSYIHATAFANMRVADVKVFCIAINY